MVRLGRGQVWGRCACGGMRQAYEEVFDGESVFGVVCCGVAMICCLLPFRSARTMRVCVCMCIVCVRTYLGLADTENNTPEDTWSTW